MAILKNPQIGSFQKRCTKCGQEFPATTEYFHRNKCMPDGLQYNCRICACKVGRLNYYANQDRERNRARAYQKQRRLDNPEEARQIKREWRAKNRARINAQAKQYRAEHRTEIQEHDRRRQRANAEKRREKNRQWRQAHPEVIRANNHRYRVQKRSARGDFSADDVQIQLHNQTDHKGIVRCWWCDKPLGEDQSIDHRIPLSRGGSNDARNICITHLRCNISKKDKLPHEWNGRLL